MKNGAYGVKKLLTRSARRQRERPALHQTPRIFINQRPPLYM